MISNSAAHNSVSVAIVGAGPTGLALALSLARQGVRTVVLERNASTSERSKAPGIHVRTREVFRQLGVEDRFVEEGMLREKLAVQAAGSNGRPFFSIDYSKLERESDRPGLLIIEQGHTERLLLEAVQATGMSEVRFGAEAVELRQDESGASIAFTENGEQHRLEADYVVGCDGAGSFVREALELPFDGITYSVRPMLADVRIRDSRDGLPWPRTRNGRSGITTAARLGEGLWRIIRLERGEPRTGEQVPEAEVGERVEEVLGAGSFELVWASRFRIHLRSAPRFRVRRVLLAGDAAHVHSPAGGFGMNGGIQDAHNLAWKLAHSLRGGDADRLLDSYDVERRAVIVENVSRYTDLLTRIFLKAPSPIRAGAFLATRAALATPGVRGAWLRRATMIDLDYPESPLLRAGDRAAGVRLPNPLVWPRVGAPVRLYTILPPAPVILDMAESREFSASLPVGRVIRIGRAGDFREPGGLLRRLLGRTDGWILVRPDAHVAWARGSDEGIEEAAAWALGW